MDHLPVTVLLTPETKAAAVRRAVAERRPLSSYLRNIIQDAVVDRDHARAGQEADHGPAAA